MKTYNIDITINKSKKNNNPSIFGSASAYIDNLILTNLKKTAPYLFSKSEPSSKTIIIDDTFGYTNNGKLKSGKTYTFTKGEDKKTIDIFIPSKKATKPDYITFSKALAHLLSKNCGDTYDFLLDDGTPVKMFADEIQIGYELLPLNEATKYIYNALSDSRKKDIIDIYINI